MERIQFPRFEFDIIFLDVADLGILEQLIPLSISMLSEFKVLTTLRVSVMIASSESGSFARK